MADDKYPDTHHNRKAARLRERRDAVVATGKAKENIEAGKKYESAINAGYPSSHAAAAAQGQDLDLGKGGR